MPTSVILAQLQQSRGDVHPTSLVFITQVNPNLRYVLGDAFVPKPLADKQAVGEYARPKNMIDSRWDWTMDGLSVSSIAGFEFTGKHQQSIVECGKDFSIGTLNRLLEAGIGPSRLAQQFDSKGRVLRGSEAIFRFRSTLELWTEGRRHDPRATWLLASRPIAATASQSNVLAILEKIFVDDFGMLPISEIDDWIWHIGKWKSFPSQQKVRMAYRGRNLVAGHCRRHARLCGRQTGEDDSMEQIYGCLCCP